MIQKLRINRPWRYGGRLYHTGLYRVPKDIIESAARQAINEGAAKVERESVVETEITENQNVVKRRKKRSAPENKQIGSAPENKSSVD